MPKVSILMPNFNTKKEYLKESIESILNQTFQDFEFIILDDGSRDDIANFIQSFKDDRIKLYKNEKNLGVSKTRNKLMELAIGEYIAWQDSDDISLSTRLENQVKFLDENPEISAVGSWLETFPNGRIERYIQTPKQLDFVGGCVFSQGTAMLKKDDFIKNNLIYDETLVTSEDYDLWARAIRILELRSLQQVLLKYRKTPNSLVHSKKEEIKVYDAKIKQSLLDNLSADKCLQNKIVKLATKHYKKSLSIKEKLFSIRNEWNGLEKHKYLTILGIGIRIK